MTGWGPGLHPGVQDRLTEIGVEAGAGPPKGLEIAKRPLKYEGPALLKPISKPHLATR